MVLRGACAERCSDGDFDFYGSERWAEPFEERGGRDAVVSEAVWIWGGGSGDEAGADGVAEPDCVA